MFAWLRKWFKKPQSERHIFRYWDGSEWLYADPLVVKRKLDEKGGEDWPKLFNIFTLPTSFGCEPLSDNLMKELLNKQENTRKTIIEMVRYAFDVQPFAYSDKSRSIPAEGGGWIIKEKTPTGLTELETINLLHSFVNWIGDTIGSVLPFSMPSKSVVSVPSGEQLPIVKSVESPSVPTESASEESVTKPTPSN